MTTRTEAVPRRRQWLFRFLAGVVLLAVLAALALVTSKGHLYMTPVLVAAPGMTLDAAAEASSVPFDRPHAAEERSFAQPDEPHAFRLSHPDHGIDLPEGRFSVLEAHRGVIFRLRVTPHLSALSLDGALELARAINAKLRDAGWHRREERPAATLRERLKEDGEDRASSFVAGEWIAEVWARRTLRGRSEMARLMGKEEDEYVVTVVVWDVRRTAETLG